MYFNIATAIVDRNDLTLEQKMACVVLARYANRSAFEGLLTIDVIAQKMGVDTVRTQTAIDGLVAKGLIEPGVVAADIVKSNDINSRQRAVQDAQFTTFTPEDQQKQTSDKPQAVVDYRQLADIFEEIVPESRLKILYQLANGDIDLLKRAYTEVKEHHKYDVIDALADYLQQDIVPSGMKQAADQPLSDDAARQLLNTLEQSTNEPADALDQAQVQGRRLNSQINLGRVEQLYKKRKT